MIVVDASAVLEVLLRTRRAETIENRIFSEEESIHAPHLLDVEVAQVLRTFTLSGTMDERRGYQALTDYMGMAITRYPHEVLMERVWELHPNLTAYDAVYVALAEALDAPLVTCDKRLASAPGLTATVEVM